MNDTEVITVYDLMDILNVGKNIAYRLLKSEAIKAFRVGRTWKIPRCKVDEFILESANKRRVY